jgi:lauroyl/myristoyl acyltransferase
MELLQQQRERENKAFLEKKTEKERRKLQRALKRKDAMGFYDESDMVVSADGKLQDHDIHASGWKRM